MLTTVLNPTLLLLAGLALTALVGMWRSWTARESVDRLVRVATTRGALAGLLLLTLLAIGARVVLGFQSPGAYAEEVLGARAFLEHHDLYAGDSRAELNRWLGTEPVSAWTLPGMTNCQVGAMEQRAQFYTAHAHTPMLLLGSVPLVYLFGGHGLYIVFLGLSTVAVAALILAMQSFAGVHWSSRTGLLIAIVVAAWQPVLAGIKQGDFVLPAAALVVVAWYLVREERGLPSAIAGGLAACLAVPAIGVVPALLRWRLRHGVVAIGLLIAALAGTMAVAGPLVLADFQETLTAAAYDYASATFNYSTLARAVGEGLSLPTAAFALALAISVTAWRCADADVGFAAFLVLGLLVAPLLWSQHLALAAVPAAVLLGKVLRHESSGALAVWALLVLLVSVPDPAVLLIGRFVPITAPSGSLVPVVPFAIVALWLWLLKDARAPVS